MNSSGGGTARRENWSRLVDMSASLPSIRILHTNFPLRGERVPFDPDHERSSGGCSSSLRPSPTSRSPWHALRPGQLPSDEQLRMGLSRVRQSIATAAITGSMALTDARLKDFGNRDAGFFKFCERFDSIELWVDPLPNDQLVLVWLLDLLRSYEGNHLEAHADPDRCGDLALRSAGR